MKEYLRSLLLLLLLLLMLGAQAASSVVKPGEDFYYLDEANVLSRETEGTIYHCNRLLEEACGAQLVVVALKDIGTAVIEEYALELFNDWGIGAQGEDNGLLLLLDIGGDDYFVATGDGLRGVFPASVLKRLFDDYLETDFAAKRYDAGVQKLFAAMFERVSDKYGADVTYTDGETAYAQAASSSSSHDAAAEIPKKLASRAAMDKEDEEDPSYAFGIFCVVILLIILICRRKRRRDGSSASGSAGSFARDVAAHAAGNVIGSAITGAMRSSASRGRARSSSRSAYSSSRSSYSSSRSSFGSSRSSFGSSRIGSFGGGRGGGGRSSGGGAGRGRH